jgi:hypothetical protein
MHTYTSEARAHIAAACVFGGATIMVLAGPILAQGNFPGGIDDTRFNVYILEHIYRWLSGQAPHLLTPGLYYPYPGTIFFSDTHAGTALIYSAFRALGASQFLAFDLWFFTGYVTTYLAAHYAFARMGAGAVAAAFGAAIFAFSLPSLAQFGHCQLVYRCAVPLALLYLWEALRRGSLRNFLLSGFWLCAQTLISVYLGYFLFLLMAAFAVALPLSSRSWQYWHATARRAALDFARLVRSPTIKDIVLVLATSAVGLATVALLWAYNRTIRIYDISRSWEEVSSMLPRPGSYFAMDGLSYWHHLSQGLTSDLPARWEQQMFMGVGVALLFLSGIFTLIFRPHAARSLPARAMFLALTVLVLATLSIKGQSLYAILAYLPGFNAVRAVSRIIVVLMFPVAMVAILGLRGLAEEVRPPILGKIAVVICGLVAAYEFMTVQRLEYSAREAQRRVDAVIAEAQRVRGGREQPILAVPQQDTLNLIDAELAAQQLGWPTVNGYSGLAPNGSNSGKQIPNCDYAIRHFEGYDDWRRMHDYGASSTITQLLQRTVFIGWPDYCRPMTFPAKWPTFSVGRPPSNELPKKVFLTAGELQQLGRLLVFTVHIHNASDEMIPATSPAPIRVSWRFVRDGGSDNPGWNTREDLAGDIAPGAEETMVLTDEVPRQPGRYRLEVSLVAETLYWFQGKGMHTLTFSDAAEVP